MNAKRAVFAIIVGGLVLAFSISRAVVDTSGIETVKGKNVLTQQDLQIIDDFMDDAVGDIVRTVDFTEVAKIRTIILNYQSTQAQYANQYSQSAYARISAGLQEARGISDPARRFKVMANLLILIDSLGYPQLADLAVAMISHENNAVRYWAVRSATSPSLWAKLGQNQSGAAQLAGRIFADCSAVVDSSSPEVLNLMAEFAGRHATPGAEQLLVRVADTRISRYADWSVRYELVDGTVLRLLSDKLASGSAAKPELGKRFGQLTSFVIQRYIKGQQLGVLPANSRDYLASVVAEVENKCLSKLMGASQATLTMALQENNINALQAEHDRLLGAGNQAGALVGRLNFTYGPAGSGRSTPLTLPDPPRSQAVAGAQAPPQQ
ncbi:MAG: hypothetical protein JW741_07320 [Sedimentisphaerales bacterium]|nr:hypothetical protein [Sedimentisphaerales bacterium]